MKKSESRRPHYAEKVKVFSRSEAKKLIECNSPATLAQARERLRKFLDGADCPHYIDTDTIGFQALSESLSHPAPVPGQNAPPDKPLTRRVIR
jgi:hypothetical protein